MEFYAFTSPESHDFSVFALKLKYLMVYRKVTIKTHIFKSFSCK